MAIDPRIALGVQAPNLGAAISQGLQNAGGIQQLQKLGQQKKIDALTGKALSGDKTAAEQLRALAPSAYLDMEGKQLSRKKTIADLDASERSAAAQSAAEDGLRGLSLLERGDTEGFKTFAQGRIARLTEAGRDPSDTQALLEMAEAGDIDGVKALLQDDQEVYQQMGVLKAPKQGTTTKLHKLYAELDQLPPDHPARPAYLDAIKKERNSQPLVNIEAESKGLNKEQEAAGTGRVEDFRNLKAVAYTAFEQNEILDQMDAVEISTGFGEQFKADAARVINALGGNGDELLGTDVASVQAFNSRAGTLLNDALAKQKGPQTDGDARRIEKTLANIGNEEAANDFIIRSMRAVNDRRIEHYEFYDDWFEDKGTLKGADRAWNEFKRKTPMLTDVIKVPGDESGLPMFFSDFAKIARQRNPNLTREEIAEGWRKKIAGAK